MDHLPPLGPTPEPQPEVLDGPLATSALTSLGLSPQILLESVELGLRHAFGCTAHDPPSLPGNIAWGKTVRALRDRLVPAKWTINNANNYATVINPAGTDAIAVAAGNAGTGRADHRVATRTSKGPVTRLRANENQFSLFELVAQQFPSPRALPGTGLRTWLLLHHVDDTAEEIRVELSLPTGIDEHGVVTGWHERIILPAVPHLPEPFAATAPEAAETENQIDIQIRRRA